MDLTPSQISSLDEMGIPVWELRSEQADRETSEQLLPCDCLVMVESLNNDKKTQHLLQAMLFSIGLSPDQFTIINSDQLQNSATPQKLLLVLGESFAQSLWGKSVVRGQNHQTLDVAISTVVSFSLDELLASPENKALVWQDLQLAKQALAL
jgi:DNA polymerase III psi subunit